VPCTVSMMNVKSMEAGKDKFGTFIPVTLNPGLDVSMELIL